MTLKFFHIKTHNYIDGEKRLKIFSLTFLLNFKTKFLFTSVSTNVFFFVHYNAQKISKKINDVSNIIIIV
jgi:hypothetical protein